MTLKAFRFDDILAVLFSAALLLLSFLFSSEFQYTSLRGAIFLMAYYAALFAFGHWLVRTLRLPSGAKNVLFIWMLVGITAFILIIPGRDMMLLEKPKYLLVALVPLLVPWWIRPEKEQAATLPIQGYTAYQLLRDLAPFLVSQICYLLLHDIIHQINPTDRDALLIWIDEILVGGPVTIWLEPITHPFLTEWFSATYSLFLIFPLSLCVIFTARAERRGMIHMLGGIVLCNYLGYIGYLAIPAIGPMYTLHYTVPLAGGWFYQVKETLDEVGRVPRDCFPSLHTCNTLLILLVVRRYARHLRWIYMPLGVSCIAATLYLRYHYTIDVIVGSILGVVVFYTIPYLERRWPGRTPSVFESRQVSERS